MWADTASNLTVKCVRYNCTQILYLTEYTEQLYKNIRSYGVKFTADDGNDDKVDENGEHDETGENDECPENYELI